MGAAVAAPVPVEVRELKALGSSLHLKQKEAARNAAEDFEAVFVAQMMEPMFKGIRTDGAFGGGNGEMVFRSMMIQEVGKEIAKSGGLGIADGVYREILRMQGLDP